MRDAMIPAGFVTSERRQTVLESERQLLGALFRAGPSTQAELTEALPLSQQSISRMANSLEGRGLVSRDERRLNGQRGQPSAILKINPQYAYTFGLSLMADGIALVLTDFTGNTVGYKRPKPRSLSQRGVVSAVKQSMDSLLTKSNVDKSRVFGLGIATSGFRIGGKATFNVPPSLEEFSFTDLELLFSEAFDLPAWAENDGNAATIGENMTGIGRRLSNFAYIYIATGIGGGVVINGDLLPGVRGNAGEFTGIVPLDQFDKRPTLESFRIHINQYGHSFETVQDVVEQYDDAWEGIGEWVKSVEPTLSLIVSATAAILDTEAIVLGGLTPRALAQRLADRVEFYDINRRSVQREHAVVLPAECEQNATAVGASLLPFAEKYFAF